MCLYRLDGARPALLDCGALREAARESWHGHEVAAALLLFDHDRVRTHKAILSAAQGLAQLLDGHARLRQDRAQQPRADRLASVKWNRHTATSLRVAELRVGTLLDD